MSQEIKVLRVFTVSNSVKQLFGSQYEYLLKEGIKVDVVCGRGQSDSEAEKIVREGLEFISLTRTFNPVKDIFAVRRLARKIRTGQYDIIHLHTPKAGLIGTLAGRIVGHPRIIFTVAGLPYVTRRSFKRFSFYIVDWLSVLLAHEVYPNSFGLRDIMVQDGFISKSLRVIAYGSSNGVDLSKYSMLKRVPKKKNLRFLFVGRVVPDKGIYELVQSFKILLSHHANASLHIAGRLEGNSSFQTFLKKEFANTQNVNYYGHVDNVHELMTECDILIFPTHREGFANVILQAAASGLPIICTRINGNVDVVQDGHSGLLVESKDVEGLVKKMTYAVEHYPKMIEMAINARQIVENKFDQKFVWSELIKIYKNEITS